MKKIIIASLFLLLVTQLPSYPVISRQLFAQDSVPLVKLSKQIIEAKTQDELTPLFIELKDLYFKDNKYSDFVEFLKSLSSKKSTLAPFTNYYIALSRYSQLKYLEESQNWDEYFANGNTYREEIIQSAEKTTEATKPEDLLHLYARLILWRFHFDQQDDFASAALSDLMNAVLDFSKETQDYQPIKEIADKLLAYGEKGKAKELYRTYVDKILQSSISNDRLKDTALGFYQERSLELAQLIYDAYIERMAKVYPKEKLIPILIDIARSFSYKDQDPKDTFYAEQVFGKIEELGPKDAFDEDLIYLRAFNLEKSKEYSKAKDLYIDLMQRYPKTSHAQEADFKIGMIYTYILGDLATGRSYFARLAQKETPSPQVVSSLYQLGLLSQWEQDYVKAKEYYRQLIEEAKSDFPETVTLVQERLREIEEVRPIDYNLKTFLDVSLKEEYAMFDMTKLDLRSSLYRAKKDETVEITSLPYTAESGCMQIELEYLWSGHTGTAKPSVGDATFSTTYIHPGTKEINLVVVSPAGVIDRNIDLVDVY